MTDKRNRNDLCSCGSGINYRKCCLLKTNKEVSDFGWYKLRQTGGNIVDHHLNPYVTQELPKDVIKTAWEGFYCGDLPESLDENVLFDDHFFIAWSLFNWIPYHDFGVAQLDPELTLAQNYLNLHGNRLTLAERDFIETINTTYYSFYSVLDVELNKKLLVKDILLGTTHTIKESQGTHQVKRGDILFSRILTLEDQSIFVGTAPWIIPAAYHHHLLHFKQWLMEENDQEALMPGVLGDAFEMTLFDHFFDMLEMAFNEPPPTLCNTDGELIQFSTSYFTLTVSPEEALNRLLPLTLSKNANAFLSQATYDKAGVLTHIELPWLKKGNKQHQGWKNTVMGHIRLKKDRLILETNSQERTERGKKRLHQYLGNDIRFQQTLIESPEQKSQSLQNVKNENPMTSDALLDLPEVQIKQMAKAHWDHWFDTPIPLLDNKTPREAAKTAIGKEQLDALLLQYECYDQEWDKNSLFQADIPRIRAELGLDTCLN